MAVPERDEIDEEDKWNVSKLYTEDELEQGKNNIKEMLQDIKDRSDTFTDSGDNLLEMLDLYSEMMRKVSKLSRYASHRSDEDTRKQEFQALKAEVQGLSAQISSQTAFIDPEIQKLDEEELEKMIESTDGLEKYSHYLDEILRMKEHTRSEEVENVLGQLSDVLDASSESYSMLTNADIEFPSVEKDGEEVQITQANFGKLLKKNDRSFRKKVFEGFYDTFDDYTNTIGTTFSKNVRSNVKMSGIRGYGSARERALDSSNIPVRVYDNLVETVEDNLDALHGHVELKKEALDVEELNMWDVYMPITEDEEPEIGFEKAKEYIVEALQPLGDKYVERVEEAFDKRWIDIYENKGKRSGAYSGGAYDTPPYILMNYQDDVSSMYTLAHEMGHSMHSYFTTENQPYVYSNYDIFVAEVASTVNEALLTRYLMENAENERIKRHALNHSLENFRNTLFRQTLFADFEHRAHREIEEGGTITHERATEIYGNLKEKWYEPAEIDDRIRQEWMRIPHFYYNFYVYQYSTGMSAAMTLSQKILSEGPEDYLEFLKTGSSKYPLEALKVAGVDMSSPEPDEQAIDIYRERIEDAEDLVGN